MPTETLTEDTTILGSQATNTEGESPATSGAPSVEPNGAKPNGSVQDPTKATTTADVKPTTAKADQPPAPEVWKFTDLKVPEGIAIDPVIGEKFTALVQDPNLSAKDRAQKLVDLQSEIALKAIEDARAEYQATTSNWEQESKKLLGSNAKQELAFGAKAIDKYGSRELREILNQSGLGSHPEVVKFVIAVGKAISEDTFAEGKPISGSKDKTAAEILYPTLPKN